MTTIERLLLIGFTAGTTLGFSACATQTYSQTGNACAGDIQRFCSDVQPGGGRILDCLKQHGPDLSPACQQAGAAAKQRISAFEQACGADLQQFCANVPQGNGAKFSCLKDNEARLSQPCQAAVDQTHPRQ